MRATQAEIIIRNFQIEHDIPSMVQLRVDIEEADQLGDATSEESLRAQFNWPGHEPALDRWVAEAVDTNGVVGYAWTFAQSPRRSIIHVGVDPAWRRRGIGRRLLDAANRRAKAKGAHEMVSGARAKSAAGHAFLRANQFTAVGTNRFFTATASSVEPPIWPQGFVIKSLAELGDLTPVVAAGNGCYADMWGHRENTESLTVEYLQETMARFPDSYCPNGIFVLFAPNEYHGPEGHPRFPAPSFYPVGWGAGGALIGRIGENGAPFVVGRYTRQRVDREGRLYLRINDDILSDNKGNMLVNVTVIPVDPEYR